MTCHQGMPKLCVPIDPPAADPSSSAPRRLIKVYGHSQALQNAGKVWPHPRIVKVQSKTKFIGSPPVDFDQGPLTKMVFGHVSATMVENTLHLASSVQIINVTSPCHHGRLFIRRSFTVKGMNLSDGCLMLHHWFDNKASRVGFRTLLSDAN